MKKYFALMLAVVLTLSLVACGKGDANDTDKKSEGVMTYAEYVAAELESDVVIETYVQAKQGWWKDGNSGVEQASIYTQDKEGAYFLYNLHISEADYNKLVPGTKIRVKGQKVEWSGEVEISGAEEFEILDGSYIAKAVDVTEVLGKDNLIDYQNQFVAFKGMKVESAAMYKWDGSGKDGDDLYFDVSVNGNKYTFTVESYLCGAGTEVYEAVKKLNVGDVVDMEGFLYWYEGVNPHITSVKVK